MKANSPAPLFTAMTAMTALGLALTTAACGSSMQIREPTPNGGTETPKPDAGTEDPIAAVEPRFLILRGNAGNESLTYRAPDGREVPIVERGGDAFCADQLFCNKPANIRASRFPFYGFLSQDHAAFAQVDLDLQRQTFSQGIYHTSLKTGERTLLSGAIEWQPLTTDQRPWDTNRYATDGSRLFASVWEKGGMRLYQSKGFGDPLAKMAELALPNIDASLAPLSTVSVSSYWVAWEVSWRGADRQLREHWVVFDREGKVALSTETLDGKACSGLAVRGTLYALSYRRPTSETCNILVGDAIAGTTRVIESLRPRTEFRALGGSIAPDGESIYQFAGADDHRNNELLVYSTKTGALVSSVTGLVDSWLGWSTDGKRVAYPLYSPDYDEHDKLMLKDLRSGRDQVLSRGREWLHGHWDMNHPAPIFTASDHHVVSVVGEVPVVGVNNVGLIAAPLDGGPLVEVEPIKTSTTFSLNAKVVGESVFYLYPSNDQLEIMQFDLRSRKRTPVTKTAENERGFVIQSAGP